MFRGLFFRGWFKGCEERALTIASRFDFVFRLLVANINTDTYSFHVVPVKYIVQVFLSPAPSGQYVVMLRA